MQKKVKSEEGSRTIDKDNAIEPRTYIEYLEDRNLISVDYNARMKDYEKRGRKVQCLSNIFQRWFTIPWLLYFIGSSLDTDYILWKDKANEDSKYGFSGAYFMVYSFSQMFLLTLPLLLSYQINTYHSDYVSRSKHQQLAVYKTSSRKALASMNKIKKVDQFDFVPQIWGTGIEVPVDNPLYILFLLVTIFFTVVKALD